jgi:DNA-binding GntR family transcriptional regulator
MAARGVVRKPPDVAPCRERAQTVSQAIPSPRLLPSVKEHRTLEELVYRDIRSAIMDGRLAPGQRVVTNAIAAESGVSRIPVIQALRRLQNRWDRGEYYRIIMHARRGGFAKESLEEHEAILRALEAGDLEKAAKAIERHRLLAMRRLEETA